jgi:MFS transporter, LPLT family, lysophospholipid transporter
MDRGFYIIMAAQFFSALADNALLITAIAMLREIDAPAAHVPMLKWFFTISYVLLAAFVGAFADSMPKGRVMLISNGIKISGCLMLIAGLPPLYAYAVVGIGAAAYSPAKYGILTEYLPHSKLVVANSWIEGLTVGAIIFGTILGGWMISPYLLQSFGEIDATLNAVLPFTLTSSLLDYSLGMVAALYLVAAWFNLYVPNTGVDHKPLHNNPLFLLRDFFHCVRLLWTDKLGQITLAVTTLFWAAGATMQFIMLRWTEEALHLPLDQAPYMQAIFAVGIALGAALAGRFIPIHRSVRVIGVGIAMGLVTLTMVPLTGDGLVYGLGVDRTLVLGFDGVWLAGILMLIVGAMAGFFVVPMNALLQHRGHILMGAGHSIAVQNFNENIGILIMLGLYALLVAAELSVQTVIILFGVFMAGAMYGVQRWYQRNIRLHRHELARLLQAARHVHQDDHSKR